MPAPSAAEISVIRGESLRVSRPQGLDSGQSRRISDARITNADASGLRGLLSGDPWIVSCSRCGEGGTTKTTAWKRTGGALVGVGLAHMLVAAGLGVVSVLPVGTPVMATGMYRERVPSSFEIVRHRDPDRARRSARRMTHGGIALLTIGLSSVVAATTMFAVDQTSSAPINAAAGATLGVGLLMSGSGAALVSVGRGRMRTLQGISVAPSFGAGGLAGAQAAVALRF